MQKIMELRALPDAYAIMKSRTSGLLGGWWLLRAIRVVFTLFYTSDSCILAHAQGLLGPTTGSRRSVTHYPLSGRIYHQLAFEVEKSCHQARGLYFVASLCDLHFTRSALYVTDFGILQRYHTAFRPSNVNAILIKIVPHPFCIFCKHIVMGIPQWGQSNQAMRSHVSVQGQTNTVGFAGGRTKTSLSGHFWRPS